MGSPRPTIAWNQDRAHATILALKELPGALLPILQALQADFGKVWTKAAATLVNRMTSDAATFALEDCFASALRSELKTQCKEQTS